MAPPIILSASVMISRFRQPRPGLLVQLAVLLLAIVQVVAPTFHTCEQGGHCPCTAMVHGRQEVVSLPPCCRHKAVGGTHGAAIDGGSSETPFTGTCLAQLLQTMPGSLYAAGSLILLAVGRTASAPTLEQAPVFIALRREPSRGPPSLNV